MQEESEIKKEKWGKPKLIVLMRGKPEERVLQYCKAALRDAEPGSLFRGCSEWVVENGAGCLLCETLGGTT